MAPETNNNRTIVLAIGGVLLILLAVFLVWGGSGKREHWSESYNSKVMHPYGTFVLYELMKYHDPEHEFVNIDASLEATLGGCDSTDAANYFFIGISLSLDSADQVSLAEFVHKGNNAMIVCRSVPYELFLRVSPDSCDEWYDYYSFDEREVTLNLNHPDLMDSVGYSYVYQEYGDTVLSEWQHFSPWYFCDSLSGFANLGTIDTMAPNFVSCRYGAGTFYFHSNPLAFTNHYVMEDRGYDYVTKVVSHLPPGDTYWDDVHMAPMGRNNDHRYNDAYNNPAQLDKNPLSFVLSQPPLAWAWYLLVAAVLLFFAFRAKRTQRIIPVLEPNTNTSLEFAQTIGQLYFMQTDHKKLSALKWKLFLSFIRGRYHLSTHHIDEELIKTIVLKSQLEEAAVRTIFTQWEWLNKLPEINTDQLIQFHKSTEHFYNNAK